jgi:outer membrane protein TolC
MQGNLFRLIAILLSISLGSKAQELLRLEDAIRLALEKNYQVLSAANMQKIADVQNNAGAAGLSPTLSLNGTVSNSNLNSYQVFNTGAVQDRTGALSNGLTGSVNADWTVFDGLRMFSIRKRLQLNEDLSALNLKAEMENTIYEVMSAYYNIVRLNELLKVGEQNIRMYEERKKIAEVRLQIGADSKVEVLLSRSDLNKALSSQYQLQLLLLQAKADLNTLLSRLPSDDFKVNDTLMVNWKPELEELKKSVIAGNINLLLAQQNELITLQSVKEAQSATLPFITLNSAYVYTKTQSQAGFLFSNRQNGLSYGLSARWLLFNGGRNTALVKERNLLALNQKFLSDQTQLKLDALVYLQYQSFQMNQKIVVLELQSLAEAGEVQSISLERYRIGKSTLIETIETQRNLEEAQSRYINALYAIKMSEAALLKANGSLLK